MAWIGIVIDILIKILKGIFGLDKPQKTTVDHPEPEVKVGDGKTEGERLEDLGL